MSAFENHVSCASALLALNGTVLAQCDPAWQPLGSGANNYVHVMAVYDDGGGPALFIGGDFTSCGGVSASRVAKWDGAAWSSLGQGVNSYVYALQPFDDGSGTDLYVGGVFTQAGGKSANRIAAWDGLTWSALGSGVNASVNAMAVFDDGSGPALIVGGLFDVAGGLSANSIAKWDGNEWSSLGSGLDGQVLALISFDDGNDGNGDALYAGGNFTHAGSQVVSYVAKWDGMAWSPLSTGTDGSVRTFAVFDDGSGPDLYVGGYFQTAGGVLVNHVARWNGTTWAALGAGTGPTNVRRLHVFDNMGSPSLCAAGFFSVAGGTAASNIARWDGSSWQPLGAGLNDWVFALATYDDGNGTRLYAGGNFNQAGSLSANRIASWGTPVPMITKHPDDLKIKAGESADFALEFTSSPGPVTIQWRRNGVPLVDDGRIVGSKTPTLLISPAWLMDAGDYDAVLLNSCGKAETRSATLTVTCYADCDGSKNLDLFDFLCFTNEFLAFHAYADCDESGFLDLFDFICFTNAFNSGC